VPGVIKRYFRHIVPISISVLLSYILLISHAYSNIQTGNSTYNTFWLVRLWDFSPDLFAMIREGLVDSVLNGGTCVYNPILWTMTVEFKGSVIVFAFLALFGKVKNRFVIYGVLIFIFYNSYFLAFILGVGLCDYRSGKHYRQIPQYLTVPLLLISLYLASFELISIEPGNKYGFLEGTHAKQNQIIYILGSFLLLAAVIHEKRFQKALSGKVLQFLGRISFSFYLLHLIVLGSFSCFVFNLLYINGGYTYHISCLITFCMSIFLLIVVSHFYYKYIDAKGIVLSEKIYKRFFEIKVKESESVKAENPV